MGVFQSISIIRKESAQRNSFSIELWKVICFINSLTIVYSTYWSYSPTSPSSPISTPIKFVSKQTMLPIYLEYMAIYCTMVKLPGTPILNEKRLSLFQQLSFAPRIHYSPSVFSQGWHFHSHFPGPYGIWICFILYKTCACWHNLVTLSVHAWI